MLGARSGGKARKVSVDLGGFPEVHADTPYMEGLKKIIEDHEVPFCVCMYLF